MWEGRIYNKLLPQFRVSTETYTLSKQANSNLNYRKHLPHPLKLYVLCRLLEVC